MTAEVGELVDVVTCLSNALVLLGLRDRPQIDEAISADSRRSQL
jgi:hypothetical protein